MPRTPLRSPIPSALARPLDPSVPSNALALGASGAAALGGLVRGARVGGPRGALRTSLAWGGGALAAWATGRELDPDHPTTAALAIPVAAVGLALGAPSPPVTLATLLVARATAGTVGIGVRPTDVAALVLVTTAAVEALRRRGRDGGPLDGPSAGAVLAAVAAAVATVPAARTRSRTDVGGRAVRPGRVGAARALTGVAVALCALAGRSGVAANVPAAAALVATAARR